MSQHTWMIYKAEWKKKTQGTSNTSRGKRHPINFFQSYPLVLQCSHKNKNATHQSYITLFNEWHYSAMCFSSQGIIIKQLMEKLYKM